MAVPVHEALDRFRQCAASRGLPPARIRAVISYVRSTAAGAVGVRGLSFDADILPVLEGLRALALDVGRARGERGGALRSRISNVALFARVVGDALGLDARDLEVGGVPESWHVLLQGLRDASARQALRDFIRLASDHGCSSPGALPDVSTISIWGNPSAGVAEVVRKGLAAYRVARRRTSGTLAPPRSPRRTIEYGLQAVPFLPALLEAARRRSPEAAESLAAPAFAGVPRARALIEQLAPLMARALAVFEARRLAAHASADYLQSAERAVSRSVASVARLLVRDGASMDVVAAELAGLSIGHFWTRRRVVADADEGGDRQHSAPDDPDLAGLDPAGGPPTAPLLRAVADDLAWHSYRASPLRVSAQAATLPVPLYTPAVVQGVRRLHAIAQDALRPKLLAAGEAGAQRWRDIDFEQRALVSHMTAVARQRRATGQVDKRLLPLHWGELVCVGLPALRDLALAAEARWDAWHAAGRGAESDRGQRVSAGWHRALTAYLVTAVFTAEGLREKNLRGARVGAQVHLTWRRNRMGGIVGVERVLTRFRGDDPAWVRLKQTHDSGGGSSPRVRVREWQWAPGVVDHRLLYRYLTEVRPELARRSGLLPEGQGYDPERDDWALFLSPRPSVARGGGQSDGGYSRGVLSDLVGRSLFWIARDVLTRPGLPSTYREACRGSNPLRGLFGAHVIRALAATWWGGLRNRWDFAEAYTNDLQPTLHAHYAKLPTWMARAVGTGGPGDPTWWGEVADVVVTDMDSTLDWDGFWREFDPARAWRAEEVRRRLRRSAEPPERTGPVFGPSARAVDPSRRAG